MRCHILNPDERLRIISDLLQEIDRQFRLAGIEIAFPQRDLHVRSVDDAAAARLQTTDHQLEWLPGDQKKKTQ